MNFSMQLMAPKFGLTRKYQITSSYEPFTHDYIQFKKRTSYMAGLQSSNSAETWLKYVFGI